MSNTNHDVAHLWTNQSKSNARSSNGNFSYSGDTIYSYSTPIGRLILDPATGEIMAVLRTSETFSVTTTGKHENAISSALRHDTYPIIHVPCLNYLDHTRNLNHFVKAIEAGAAKARKSTSNAEWTWRSVQSLVKNGNEYIKLFNQSTHTAFTMPADHAESLAKSLERLRKLNNPDPASLDKRERDRARRHATKSALNAKKHAETVARMAAQIEQWKAGREGYLPYGAPMLLRLRPNDPDTLETSKGAHVPLDAAKHVFSLAAKCREMRASFLSSAKHVRIGDFHLDGIDPDGTIHAGCHTIPWEESARMAAEIGLIEKEIA